MLIRSQYQWMDSTHGVIKSIKTGHQTNLLASMLHNYRRVIFINNALIKININDVFLRKMQIYMKQIYGLQFMAANIFGEKIQQRHCS